MTTRTKVATVLATLTAALVAIIATSLPTQVRAQENPTMTQIPKPTKTGHAAVNGVNYYYAVYGKGEPLLLLHGGLGQIEMFGPNLALLAQSREVIGVDLHGHGRTDLGTRDISLIDMGDDLAVILKKLGYKQVDVMGYSMGGGTAFRLAVQHPELVRRLVIVSSGMSQDQFYPEMLPQQAAVGSAMAEQMKGTPMYQSYVAVAPHPEDFPKLLDRMGAYMRKPYDWSAEVKKLTMPTMLVYGDSDMMRPEHIVKFYQLLGGGLKDAGWQREHDIFIGTEVTATALPFLDGYPKAKSWAEQVSGAK
jgi:pimeloyl-ACP methyl ester carboxylesterase